MGQCLARLQRGFSSCVASETQRQTRTAYVRLAVVCRRWAASPHPPLHLMFLGSNFVKLRHLFLVGLRFLLTDYCMGMHMEYICGIPHAFLNLYISTGQIRRLRISKPSIFRLTFALFSWMILIFLRRLKHYTTAFEVKA